MAIAMWSNENRPRATSEAEGFFVLGSHTVRPAQLKALRDRPELLEDLIVDVGGCLTVVTGDEVRIRIACTAVPAVPVYLGEGNGFVAVSSLAHAVAAINNNGRTDPLALHSLVQAGFVTGSRTAYDNVASQPLGAFIEISVDRVRNKQTLKPAPVSDDPHPALAEALADAVRPLQDLDGPVTLSLSGGRDSRLIAAALHAASVDFVTVTRGEQDHPDVEIAALVAARLGTPHRVVPRGSVLQDETQMVEDPWQRAGRVADITEGSTSAWDDVSVRGPWLGSVTLSGIGGEVLRGGYAYSLDQVNRVTANKKISNLFGGESLLTAEAIELARWVARPWRQLLEEDPATMLDHLYLHERLGRWGVARKAAISRNLFFGPFLDNRVIRTALAIPPRVRWSEKPMAELVEHLAPQLAEIPLEGRPWRYCHQTTEATPRSPTRRADWRLLGDPGLRERVHRALLPLHGDGATDFFHLVDRDKLSLAFQTDAVTATKMWHMLTARAFFAEGQPGSAGETKAMTIPIGSG